MTIDADPTKPLFIYALRTVTEDAALAAFDWIGRGKKEEGDGAAVDAMRKALNEMPMDGTIVIGEGEKDEAPQLYNGEHVGDVNSPHKYDIAVDPVEGTSYLAKGLTNSMATIALAPKGSMFDPGPAFYMEKFAAPPAAYGQIDPEWPVKVKLQSLASLLHKPIADLRVFVLEKPRHEKLIQEIHEAGARAVLYPAGDVAGALMASIPGSGIDCLMGTGGTPEGVMSAAAVRAMGGEFIGRLNPQGDDEKKAVLDYGLCIDTHYKRDELIKSQEVLFSATGITTGLLFDGVERTSTHDRLQTLMISGHTQERQILTTYRARKMA